MRNITNKEPTVIILGDVKDDGTPDIANILFKFPVPHKKMRIRQEVKIDSIEIPGRSGKIKQATGYSDSQIEIILDIVDIENRQGIVKSAQEQLDEIQKAFRKRDKNKLPRIFSISSLLTDTCGIRNVLFKGLEVEDISGNTALRITLLLTEFEPIAVQVDRNRTRRQVIKSAQNKAQNAASSNQDSKNIDNEIGTESPLAAAYRNGKKAAMGGTEPWLMRLKGPARLERLNSLKRFL